MLTSEGAADGSAPFSMKNGEPCTSAWNTRSPGAICLRMTAELDAASLPPTASEPSDV